MRRKIHRSSHNSSPVVRRVFRPALGRLEARVLLSGSPTYYTVNLTSDTGASSGTDATTGDPSGDLLWAVTQADNQGQPGYAPANAAGSVINFDPTVFTTAQTITLSSTLVVSESDGPQEIQGPGASLVTITGNNSVGVFQVDGGVTASIAGVTISGGTASSGAGVDNNGTLPLSNSVISSNTATGSGGGLVNLGTATLSGCTFATDSASGGGGIENDGALTVSTSSFTGNTARVSGGGGISNFGTVTLTGSSFSNNQTSDNGGGGGFQNDYGLGSITGAKDRQRRASKRQPAHDPPRRNGLRRRRKERLMATACSRGVPTAMHVPAALL